MEMEVVFVKSLIKKIIQYKKIILILIIFAVLNMKFLISRKTEAASATTTTQSVLEPDLYSHTLDAFEDISCYYSRVGDALLAIGEDFAPPANSIFFHETSCTGRLNSRQACAVESAARIHPQWQINVLFVGPATKESLNLRSLNILKKMKNVKLMRIHLLDYARGTPLEDLVSSGALNRSQWRISHTSDTLRFLSLYKWGGVYLDLDMVVSRSFEELAPNWAARESDSAVGSAVLAFSRDALGRDVAGAAIRDISTNFRGDVWGHNGPGVITRVLKDLCSVGNLTDMSAVSCKGFEVYGPELFYPIPWTNANEYFEDKEPHFGNPVTYHVWNKLTQNLQVRVNSIYAHLARKYCPEVYEAYGDNFGL